MKRKLMSLFLVVVMLCAFVPTMVNAATANGTCGDHLTWSLNNSGVLTISGTGDMYNYIIEDDGTTKPLPPWDSYKTNDIKSLVIGNGVTSIGRHAFSDCYSLGSVTISPSVKRIGGDAFAGAGYYTNGITMTLPEGVEEIGTCVLHGANIRTLSVPSSVINIGDGALWDAASNINGIAGTFTDIYYYGTAAEWAMITVCYPVIDDDLRKNGTTLHFLGTGVRVGNMPAVSNGYIGVGQQNTYFETSMRANAAGTYRYEAVDLPDGIQMSEDGKIAGTPTRMGVYPFVRVRITDAAGKVNEIRNMRLPIMKQRVDFTVTDNVIAYDGQPHKAMVVPTDGTLKTTLIEGRDYEVLYGGQSEQQDVATYAISVKMIGDACNTYKAGELSLKTLVIRP